MHTSEGAVERIHGAFAFVRRPLQGKKAHFLLDEEETV